MPDLLDIADLAIKFGGVQALKGVSLQGRLEPLRLHQVLHAQAAASDFVGKGYTTEGELKPTNHLSDQSPPSPRASSL